MERPIRVLIVDDSPTARHALREALGGDAQIHVVGEASHADEALEQVDRLRPDLVTMDVYMKGRSGLEITADIMHTAPRPILVVTGVDPTNPSLLYEAMRVGALEVCAKLPATSSSEYAARRAELTRLVRCLARVPVVRRRRPPMKDIDRDARRPSKPPLQGPPELIVMGASTGGPPVVCELLRRLPRTFAIPVALVQHMAEGFLHGFTTWLEGQVGRRVVVVDRRATPEPGVIYVGGEGRHLQVTRGGALAPLDGPERNYHRPSVDVLFRSAASELGARAIGVLLTGMGADGAEGLRLLFDRGAWTVAQEPSTCAADGMPRSAIQRGGAKYVVTPDEMVGVLLRAHNGGKRG
jgi:two-component system chemotaxis response regulator CheB